MDDSRRELVELENILNAFPANIWRELFLSCLSIRFRTDWLRGGGGVAGEGRVPGQCLVCAHRGAALLSRDAAKGNFVILFRNKNKT